MSVQTQINRINGEVSTQSALMQQIITELQNKSSGGGITPIGTIDITENGEYDVTQYAQANVAIPDAFRFTGKNAQLVDSFTKTYSLSDTSFVIGSSEATAATSIRATEANFYTSPTIAFGDKDIVIVQKMLVTPTHGSGSTAKARTNQWCCIYLSTISMRKTTNTSAKTTRQVSTVNSTMHQYYNTSGTLTRGANSYGFYGTPQAPTVASATATSTTVRAGSPILYYRVNASYETAANIKTVTACTWKWTVDVYTVDTQTALQSAINDDIDNMLVNGL